MWYWMTTVRHKWIYYVCFHYWKKEKRQNSSMLLEVRLMVAWRRLERTGLGTREIGLLRCCDVLSIDPCAGCKGVFMRWKCTGVCTHRIIWLCHTKPPPYPVQAVSMYFALAGGGQNSGLCWASLGCKLWDEGRTLPHLSSINWPLSEACSFKEKGRIPRGVKENTQVS